MSTNTQQLGGTRQSSPLDDEMSYPLTKDEYLTIKENLLVDKFTNWESFLITTAITSLISGIVLCVTGDFQVKKIIDNKEVIKINMLFLSILIIYGALTFGSIVGFIVTKISKKKAEKPMHRLDTKIMSHLNKVTNE